MADHKIIVIGASAGGVEAMVQVVRDLPPDLPAAVFIVVHFPPDGTSVLPQILRRHGALPVEHARDGEPIQPGRIYIAPPDRHLLIKKGFVRVARGPQENGHRPAIDPLFRTAALMYGPQVIGVILTGTLDDGTAGLLTVKRRGGLAVVQDPDTALYEGMPRSAIENVEVDKIVPLSQVAPTLVALALEPVEDEPMERDPGEEPQVELEAEADMAELESFAVQQMKRPGNPSGFGCPDCGGALWELTEDNLIRFRCRIGHAYTADTLLSKQTEQLEEAMWTALRALEESAALSHRLYDRAASRGHKMAAARFDTQEKEMRSRADLIREVLLNSDFFNKIREEMSAHPGGTEMPAPG